MSDRALAREEESKLLRRRAHKPKKPYVIESRMPNSAIPPFTQWRCHSRYETEGQRDQALQDLRKKPIFWALVLFEYRKAGQETQSSSAG